MVCCPLLSDCLQKVPLTIRWVSTPPIKAFKAVLQLRLPTQVTLMCGTLTLEPTIVAKLGMHTSLHLTS